MINYFAKDVKVLPRALSYIYENIRDFWVVEDDREIIGCVALHIIWEDLAEIKSLVVKQSYHGQGIGSKLVKVAIKEAGEYEVKKIFVLTYIPEYFFKFGFKPIDKSELPHKIWADCINCPKFPDCKEEALIKEVESSKI